MLRLPLLISALLLAAAPSFGSIILSYTLDPATYTAIQGDTVNIEATLQNVGTTDPLYVNDYRLTLNGAAGTYLSEDILFNFFDSVPGLFFTTDPATDYMVEQLDIAPTTPFGVYTGTVELIGGADPSALNPIDNNLGKRTFTINVVAPEPDSIGLMGLGLLALAGWATRIRSQRVSHSVSNL